MTKKEPKGSHYVCGAFWDCRNYLGTEYGNPDECPRHPEAWPVWCVSLNVGPLKKRKPAKKTKAR